MVSQNNGIRAAETLEVSDANLPSEESRAVYRYWQRLKGDRDLPRWEDFDPLDIKESLPDIILYASHKDGSYSVRIVGEDCRHVFHIPSKPAPIEDVVPEKILQDVLERLDEIKKTQRPVLIRRHLDWIPGARESEKEKQYTALFLPFSIQDEVFDLKILTYIHFY